jgi:hypothetical protein
MVKKISEVHLLIMLLSTLPPMAQTDNFRLFLCKQTDKGQTSVYTMSER